MKATLLHTQGKLRVPVLVTVLGLALLGIALGVVVVQAQGSQPSGNRLEIV